ncbi:MAG: hypothetical protein FVQ85_00980 [Planctomycetes bacterium]|nr:hypothetical protein [Planctomycetota bacterium]
MNTVSQARLVVLRNCKLLAPPFHRHIVKAKLMERNCQVGDRIVIYEVVATEPEGIVQVTSATRFEFK